MSEKKTKREPSIFHGLVLLAVLLIIILLIYSWIDHSKHYIEHHLDERTFLP